MTLPKAGQTVCGTCGHGMVRKVLAHLCFGGGKGSTLYEEPTCSNPECPDVLQDAADRAAAQTVADNQAIQLAILRGVIDP